MRQTASISCVFVLAALAPFPGIAAGSDGCRATASPREDRLEAVEPRGELRLGSGERAVLSGLHWPEDDVAANAARTWLLDRRERPLTVATRGEPDRWGRTRIDAATSDGDLAGGLIAGGFALADAGEDDALCRPDLLALEEAPRKAGLGLWAAPIRDARDGAGLTQSEGDFILAQGRVVSVGERGRRTYLNFSAKGQSGLSVTVPKRTWRIMQERGLTAATLKGRLVRVRGRVEIWRGPMLDLVSADAIEMLEGGQAPKR